MINGYPSWGIHDSEFKKIKYLRIKPIDEIQQWIIEKWVSSAKIFFPDPSERKDIKSYKGILKLEHNINKISIPLELKV